MNLIDPVEADVAEYTFEFTMSGADLSQERKALVVGDIAPVVSDLSFFNEMPLMEDLLRGVKFVMVWLLAYPLTGCGNPLLMVGPRDGKAVQLCVAGAGYTPNVSVNALWATGPIEPVSAGATALSNGNYPGPTAGQFGRCAPVRMLANAMTYQPAARDSARSG